MLQTGEDLATGVLPLSEGSSTQIPAGGSSGTQPAGNRSRGWAAAKGVVQSSARSKTSALRRLASKVQRELADKGRAVACLRPETQAWLHVNAFGVPLPPGARVAGAAAGAGAAGAAAAGPKGEAPQAGWRSTFAHYRTALHTLMTDPDSSRPAYVLSLLILLTILLSSVAFCLETNPAWSGERDPGADAVFSGIELVTVQVFAADYLLRLLSCPHLLSFVTHPLNVIDLVSVVPWYVEKALAGSGLQGTAVFRVLRLLRVFRVLKLGARYRKLLIVTGALAKSLDMLVLMVFFVALITVAAATLIFFAERGSYDKDLGYYVRRGEPGSNEDGSPAVSPFESIPASFWWAIVTLMTVGYGDVFPISVGGRVVACATMLCGILFIALPVAVIGTNFSSEWEAFRTRGGGEGPACPGLEALAVAAREHAAALKDLHAMLVHAVEAGSSGAAGVAERNELRGAELEEQARQRAATLTPQQAVAVREVLACLARLGQGQGEAAGEEEAEAGLGSQRQEQPRSIGGRRRDMRDDSVRAMLAGDSQGARPGLAAGLSARLLAAVPSCGLPSGPLGGIPSRLGSQEAPPPPHPQPPRHDGPARLAARLQSALATLEGTPLHAKLRDEVLEVLAAEPELSRASGHLSRVLAAAGLLGGGGGHGQLPAVLEVMRSQYRQLAALGKEAGELRSRLEALGGEVEELQGELDKSGRDVIMDVVAALPLGGHSGKGAAGGRSGRASHRPSGTLSAVFRSNAVADESSAHRSGEPPVAAVSAAAGPVAASSKGAAATAAALRKPGPGGVQGQGEGVGRSRGGGLAAAVSGPDGVSGSHAAAAVVAFGTEKEEGDGAPPPPRAQSELSDGESPAAAAAVSLPPHSQQLQQQRPSGRPPSGGAWAAPAQRPPSRPSLSVVPEAAGPEAASTSP